MRRRLPSLAHVALPLLATVSLACTGPADPTASTGDTARPEPPPDTVDTGTPDGPTADTGPITTEDTGGTTTALSYDRDVEPILVVCTGCHQGSSSGGFNFDDGLPDLFQASQDVPSLDYVSPGAHTDSYLWHKVNGSHGSVGGSGSRMPIGGTLSDEDIATLADWIDAGAEP